MFARGHDAVRIDSRFRAGPCEPLRGEQARAIKSLPDRDVAGLIDGQGARLREAAELNGYPGPAHNARAERPPRIERAQVAASEQLMREHKRNASELGPCGRGRATARACSRSVVQSRPCRCAARDVGCYRPACAPSTEPHLAQTALSILNKSAPTTSCAARAGIAVSRARSDNAPRHHH